MVEKSVGTNLKSMFCENPTKWAVGRAPAPKDSKSFFFFSLFLGFLFMITNEVHAYYWKAKSKHGVNSHRNNSVHPATTTAPSVLLPLSLCLIFPLSVGIELNCKEPGIQPYQTQGSSFTFLHPDYQEEGSHPGFVGPPVTGLWRPSVKQHNIKFRY